MKIYIFLVKIFFCFWGGGRGVGEIEIYVFKVFGFCILIDIVFYILEILREIFMNIDKGYCYVYNSEDCK